jgi:multidrug resistance protein MdtO
MATAVAQKVARPAPASHWFWDFLKEELSPYPGRGALVARIVVASTIVMILTLVFRLPYGTYGTIFALTISRENPESTVKAAKTIIIWFGLSVLYILLGATLFLVEPLTRFLWVVGTFFLMFYGLQVLSNYTAAARFGYLLIITIPLWDEHISSGQRVDNTLWAFGVISLASIIVVATELVYASLKPQNDLIQSIGDRLLAIEDLLKCYSETGSVDSKVQTNLTNLALTGTSRMRRFLQRSDSSAQYAEQMGTVVALVGRLIDIAANLTNLGFSVSDADRARMPALAKKIAGIREALAEKRIPNVGAEQGSYNVPLLRELDGTVSLISAVFTGSQSLSEFAPRLEGGDPHPGFFVRDAFSNPEHVKFALRGCLAASLCYIVYNAKDWPGLSTSVTTCFLTALSTIGASRQKQVLRIAGAIVGGLLLGLGAQIFVFPYLDSVTGFTLVFLAVTIPVAWIATSGPRLSYFGVQIFVAFCLINLSEFKVQTSLVLGRDRVIGIFLGLLTMWLAFDQLWASPAAAEMKKVFVLNLRLLAQFAREPISRETKIAIERSYSLRETINKNFDSIRALADGVVLEFGPSREQDLALRARFKQWQPQLRTLFLTRIALWKYRMQLPGFQLPPATRAAQQEFDEQSADLLEHMADRMEGKDSVKQMDLAQPLHHLEWEIENAGSTEGRTALPELQTFLFLSRRAENLESSLNQAMEAHV